MIYNPSKVKLISFFDKYYPTFNTVDPNLFRSFYLDLIRIFFDDVPDNFPFFGDFHNSYWGSAPKIFSWLTNGCVDLAGNIFFTIDDPRRPATAYFSIYFDNTASTLNFACRTGIGNRTLPDYSKATVLEYLNTYVNDNDVLLPQANIDHIMSFYNDPSIYYRGFFKANHIFKTGRLFYVNSKKQNITTVVKAVKGFWASLVNDLPVQAFNSYSSNQGYSFDNNLNSFNTNLYWQTQDFNKYTFIVPSCSTVRSYPFFYQYNQAEILYEQVIFPTDAEKDLYELTQEDINDTLIENSDYLNDCCNEAHQALDFLSDKVEEIEEEVEEEEEVDYSLILSSINDNLQAIAQNLETTDSSASEPVTKSITEVLNDKQQSDLIQVNTTEYPIDFKRQSNNSLDFTE